jgi:SOS-response transcriptional repressor LexA
MTAPTPRQLSILRFIAAGIDRGLPPTMREISHAFRFVDTKAAADHMFYLTKKGLIRTEPSLARAVTITDLGRHYAPVRIVTGIVEPPSHRCTDCSRVFFGVRAINAHRCAEKDKRAA